MGAVVSIDSSRSAIQMRNVRSAVRKHCETYHVPDSCCAPAVTFALKRLAMGDTMINSVKAGLDEADRLYGLWLDSFANKCDEDC